MQAEVARFCALICRLGVLGPEIVRAGHLLRRARLVWGNGRHGIQILNALSTQDLQVQILKPFVYSEWP